MAGEQRVKADCRPPPPTPAQKTQHMTSHSEPPESGTSNGECAWNEHGALLSHLGNVPLCWHPGVTVISHKQRILLE